MASRKTFNDSVTPLPNQPVAAPMGLLLHAKSAEHDSDRMSLLFSLDTPADAEADLERRVAAGTIVAPTDLAKYGADQAAHDKLAEWLKGQGYTITSSSSDGSSIYAEAPMSLIEKTLQVEMVRVVKDGVAYTSARNAPSLPDDIGAPVHAIIGLQPFRQAHKHFRRLKSAARSPQPIAAPNLANKAPYLVSEILRAYGANDLGLTGKGQTIAILIDTFPAEADLKAFWARNGLNDDASRIEMINVNKVVLPPREGEETLDAQWTSGIAPEAKIKIYASGSLAYVDLDRTLDRIIADATADPEMRQLSISLGLGETYLGGPSGEVKTQHKKFLRLAAIGVNVFVSSGDAGSNPDDSGHGSSGPLQAEYESSDTCVIGVGGTSLHLSTNGSVASETAWPGSGGGKSIFFDPDWQKSAPLPSGTKRLVPDVALAADPNTGALVVLSGSEETIGGTSWSAPVWAGFCALLNEARVKNGKQRLPFLNPLLYPLLGTSCFRDIVKGSNGAFDSVPGYDMVTGLGVPNMKELVARLG